MNISFVGFWGFSPVEISKEGAPTTQVKCNSNKKRVVNTILVGLPENKDTFLWKIKFKTENNKFLSCTFVVLTKKTGIPEIIRNQGVFKTCTARTSDIF